MKTGRLWTDTNYESEELTAYEIGYRVQPLDNLSFDLSAYYNDYDKLQSFEAVPPLGPPPSLTFDNMLEGQAYGLELAMDWRPLEWWRIQAAYSYIKLSIHTDDGSTDSVTEQVRENSSPNQQLSLRSSMDFGRDWELDIWAYYVDELTAASVTAVSTGIQVKDYTSLNLRLAWKPRKDLELSLIGQNLLDNRHLEFIGESYLDPAEVERSIFGQIRWNF